MNPTLRMPKVPNRNVTCLPLQTQTEGSYDSTLIFKEQRGTVFRPPDQV